MNIDVASFAAVDSHRDHLAALVFSFSQDNWRNSIQIPYIVSDVLEVPLVLTCFEINSDHRVGVQVVTRTLSTVQVRRWIASDEESRFGFAIDSRSHPYATTQSFVEITVLCQSSFFCSDVTMHVATCCIVNCPGTLVTFFRNGVECPDQFAAVSVIGFHETANAIFTTVGTDQYFAISHCWSHRFAVAQFWISDLSFPQHLACFSIECDEFCIQRAHVELAFRNSDTFVIWAAAVSRYRTDLVLVVPVLLTS